jgi:membrane-bound inhibitor of C-type lysozyme
MFRGALLGANMKLKKAAIFWAAIVVTGVAAGASSASAQTFDTYRCADGTSFIVGFYAYDSRAHLQIDGRPVTLKKRLAFSGRRYSGGGISLVMTGKAALLRHARRPATACEP